MQSVQSRLEDDDDFEENLRDDDIDEYDVSNIPLYMNNLKPKSYCPMSI